MFRPALFSDRRFGSCRRVFPLIRELFPSFHRPIYPQVFSISTVDHKKNAPSWSLIAFNFRRGVTAKFRQFPAGLCPTFEFHFFFRHLKILSAWTWDRACGLRRAPRGNAPPSPNGGGGLWNGSPRGERSFFPPSPKFPGCF